MSEFAPSFFLRMRKYFSCAHMAEEQQAVCRPFEALASILIDFAQGGTTNDIAGDAVSSDVLASHLYHLLVQDGVRPLEGTAVLSQHFKACREGLKDAADPSQAEMAEEHLRMAENMAVYFRVPDSAPAFYRRLSAITLKMLLLSRDSAVRASLVFSDIPEEM